MPRSHLHHSQWVQCADWAHYCRDGFLYRGGDIERHPGPKRASFLRRRDVLMQDVSPTAAVSKFEEHFRVKNIHGPREFVNHGLNDIRNAVWSAVRVSATSWPPLAVQCLCSNVVMAYRFQTRPWIVWPVWWPLRQNFAKFATRQSSRRRPRILSNV